MLKALVLAVVLVLTGCGGGDYEEEEEGTKSIPANPCKENPRICAA